VSGQVHAPAALAPYSKSDSHSLQRLSAHSAEQKTLLLVLGLDPRTIKFVASHYTD
jgi:hypothetical protein